MHEEAGGRSPDADDDVDEHGNPAEDDEYDGSPGHGFSGGAYSTSELAAIVALL